ncbi:MAG: hypothetical protein V1738_03330 [Patescibacteria group bacterium]
MTSVETAIVPMAGEAALAKPHGEPVLMRRRQFVRFYPPTEAYRESGGPSASYLVQEREDLSVQRFDDIIRWDSTGLGLIGMLQMFSQMAALGLIGIHLNGIDGGCLLSIVGIATGAPIMFLLSKAGARRKISRLLAGRKNERDEIVDAAQLLIQLAKNEIEFGTEPILFPVESLFLALANDDELVQRFAAVQIASLPEDVLMDFIAKYSHHLKFEQLKLLPGMENMTRAMFAMRGVGANPGEISLEVLPAK